jgi:hypothetical protein
MRPEVTAVDQAADELRGYVAETERLRPPPPRPPRRGPSPWLVLGAAFAAGMLAAKIVDWRGHAHPRR